ncbi:UvrD-helicase domain-containing protein, partial [Desulfovibrio sp. OttesenSCG-928-A18]|nr:UvrD-helicase domain-containing protein [Desulfovibrio sp. OttesenSCG-928-A18]
MITQISASAGSGKTYNLTRRFLDLLGNAAPLAALPGCVLERDNRVYSLAEILAATFTNKAAAEMKKRMLGALKQSALDERARAAAPARGGQAVQDGQSGLAGQSGGPGKAEQWVERILRNFGRLNIRTIDSLLSSLVRLSALPLGISPDFTPSFEPEDYFSPVYDALMEDLRTEYARAGSGEGAGPASVTARREQARAREAEAPGSDGADPFVSATGAALSRALASACQALVQDERFRGFMPGRRLRGKVLDLVQRLLEEKPVPKTAPGEIRLRLEALHAALLAAVARLEFFVEEETLALNANLAKFLKKCEGGHAFSTLPDCAYLQRPGLDECLNKSSKGKASPEAEEAFSRLQLAVAAF